MPSTVAAVNRSPSESELPDSAAARASNWAGFITFAGLAAWTTARMPAVAFFLLPAIALEVLTAVAFLIRKKARATHSNLAGKAAAYGGTFLILGFFHAARSFMPDLLIPNAQPFVARLAFMSWLAGSILAVVSIWHLRHAFSIEPQARAVARTGPYKWVRHPVYGSYILQNVGLLLIYPTLPFAFVLSMWVALTLTRIRYEEQILASAFPEYAAYQRSTGAVLPFGRFRRARIERRSQRLPEYS